MSLIVVLKPNEKIMSTVNGASGVLYRGEERQKRTQENDPGWRWLEVYIHADTVSGSFSYICVHNYRD